MPNIWGLFGIFLTTAGAYILNLGGASDFFAPFRAVAKEKGSLIMLLVSFLWSFAATFDKVALLDSSPYFYLFIFNASFFLFYIPFLQKKNPGFIREAKNFFFPLLLLGTFAGLTVLFQMIALEVAFVSYVIAIKRSGMIVTLIFGWLFFAEEIDFYRIAGTLMMVSGVIIIAFLN
ncbi:MAG: EamA family transporter [Elusimicrobia bacterium]|nr:EamA family transporter [Elusimicrobiota bacterium]